MNAKPTDRESVRRVLRGDLDEFSRLVATHSPRMLRLATGIVRRQDVAEDVVQDALVKAYEKLGGWRGDCALSTWLYRIVYTTALSSLRSMNAHGGARREFLEADDLGAVSAAEAAAAVSEQGEEWRVTEENIARMRRALERLSPLDRTLVNLFYLEDKSVRDVAAICGESESNVKTRLHRARGRLHELMKEMA